MILKVSINLKYYYIQYIIAVELYNFTMLKYTTTARTRTGFLALLKAFQENFSAILKKIALAMTCTQRFQPTIKILCARYVLRRGNKACITSSANLSLPLFVSNTSLLINSQTAAHWMKKTGDQPS